MKSNFKKSLSFVLTLMLMILSFSSFLIASAKENINRFNVVFVIDASWSLKETDGADNRFEALDLFLGMLANDGNYVGTVSFNDTFKSSAITELSGNKSKKALSEALRDNTPSGDTDIGGALLEAVSMLNNQANPDMESIIILLSDGNTDMDTQELQEKSLNDKAEAVEQARDAGYKIYTIFLNSNKEGDPKEIEQIANATGGEFEEVSKASDLSNVFEKFYSQIYGTKSSKLVDTSIPSGKTINEKFSVKGVGVEEINIAVFGDINNVSVKKPDGKRIEGAELKKMTYSTPKNNFRIIKLLQPEAGTWVMTITGKAGSKIKVVKSYNTNLDMNVKVESDSFRVNSAIPVSATLFEGSEQISQINNYEVFDATLIIKDYKGKTVKEIKPETIDEKGYHFSFTPEKINTYYGVVTVIGDEAKISSEQLAFNVENSAPYATEDVIKKHVNIWPFLFKTDATVDLSSCAKDSEDSKLTYIVNSSTWDESEYTLEDNLLTVNSFKNYSKGSFEIQAVDSLGSYCTVNVKYTSTNIGVLTLCIILLAILLTVVLLGAITYKKAGIPFMGDIVVTNVSNSSLSAKQSKNRGSIKLSYFVVGDTGFHKGTRFQATGKDYVYMVSKKKMYSDRLFRPAKKIKVDQSGIVVYSDAQKTKGISVKFISMNNNNNWF